MIKTYARFASWVVLWAMVLAISPSLSLDEVQPLVLVFTPEQTGYGNQLATLIREYGTIDSQILVIDSEDLFETMIHFPYVRVIVVSLAEDGMRDSMESLNWFFNEGGGVVGLGFAGSSTASGPASQNAFPLFANDYRSGKYDPQKKRFSQTFVKDEVHEISDGLTDFTIAAQRLVVSWNKSTGKHVPKGPEVGDWTVLYRDSVCRAPAIVAYEGNGTSVTFATFGGEDFERGSGYYGLFSATEEFRTLFARAVDWVWRRERKYQSSIVEAERLFEARREKEKDVRERASEESRESEKARLIQVALTVALAAVSCIAIYWVALLRPRR